MIGDALFWVSYGGVWLLLLFQTIVLLGLVKMVAQLQSGGVASSEVHIGLSRGQTAPNFSIKDVDGRPVGTEDFVGQAVSLLFVSPSCPSCMATLYEMEALLHKTEGNLLVICRSDEDGCTSAAANFGSRMRFAYDVNDELSKTYGIVANPTAVLIDPMGRIEKYGNPMRKEEIETMSEWHHVA